ncbi:PRKR-interacting protein 1 isoform X1 [Mustela erminea]|uniref:PRKR-interacting protein 1 isoform X1 n=1 Tax=Mustela erminea TaxID=36723 RepID=UPI001387038D|nr:PRKR-interacting protein 1 isoform X1 [Mustela erminea]
MASSAASSVRPPRPKKEPQALVIPKNAAEEQKLKLERLMKNPDKAVPIPEKMSEWAPRPPPEFVRDVMGSSAGAGSGEFHVYRHLRRREYQRQDYMDAMAEKQKLDAEFQKRLERNKIAAEEQTAKRRKKRQKLKEKKLLAKKMKLEQKKQKEAFAVTFWNIITTMNHENHLCVCLEREGACTSQPGLAESGVSWSTDWTSLLYSLCAQYLVSPGGSELDSAVPL